MAKSSLLHNSRNFHLIVVVVVVVVVATWSVIDERSRITHNIFTPSWGWHTRRVLSSILLSQLVSSCTCITIPTCNTSLSSSWTEEAAWISSNDDDDNGYVDDTEGNNIHMSEGIRSITWSTIRRGRWLFLGIGIQFIIDCPHLRQRLGEWFS